MIIREVIAKDQCLRVSVSGRIDINTSPELREYTESIDAGIRKIVFDFRDVEYISSAGIRELLICRKRFCEEDAMKIVNVSKDVFGIFEMTGFNESIPLELMTTQEPTFITMSFKAFCAHKADSCKERPFIVESDKSYSWTDIEMGAQLIADDLKKLGVDTGTHVGICGRNSIGWIMTFFAVQKLGAIALLVNPSLTVNEIRTVAGIAGMTHFCYGEINNVSDYPGFISSLKADDSQVREVYSFVNASGFEERRSYYETIRNEYMQSIDADAPCTMIFTSGSTGRPKGVILSSYNILNAAYYNSKDQTLTSEDRTCLILPLFHIFGLVAGLFANAIADSAIYIPKDIRTDTLVELIPKHRLTIFHSIPTMLIALMNNKAFRADEFASLRCTIISGSAATQAQIRMFKEKLPNDHFLSSYGLSEMAPVSITEYDDSVEHVLYTVGRPVKNIRIKIITPGSGTECMTGSEGEILVQGYNLMVGYYKVPIDDQAIDDEGWLHTGDLGFLDEDGYLHFSGRLKELIIRGGENIMPGEIEKVLSEYDEINNVKVLGMPSEFFGEEVAACVLLKDGAVFDEAAIRASLSGKLAKFKIPSKFIVFDSFPVLGTGKIDSITLKKQMLERIGEEQEKDI